MKKYFLFIFLVLTFIYKPGSSFASGNTSNYMFLKKNMTGGSTDLTSDVVSTFNSVAPFKYYTLAVSNTASGTTFDVRLEGSLDKVVWTTVLITNSSSGTISNMTPMPFMYLRVRANSLTTAKDITASAVGVM